MSRLLFITKKSFSLKYFLVFGWRIKNIFQKKKVRIWDNREFITFFVKNIFLTTNTKQTYFLTKFCNTFSVIPNRGAGCERVRGRREETLPHCRIENLCQKPQWPHSKVGLQELSIDFVRHSLAHHGNHQLSPLQIHPDQHITFNLIMSSTRAVLLKT